MPIVKYRTTCRKVTEGRDRDLSPDSKPHEGQQVRNNERDKYGDICDSNDIS